MPRLFVAIDLPPEVKESIADLCYGVRGVRWVGIDQLHLTLSFLGEVDNGTMQDVCESLATIQADPFTVTLKGAGYFPPRKDPRVLWIGVEKNPALLDLADHVAKAVDAAGVISEKRKFSPHVTVGRIKDPIPPERLIPFLQHNALFATDPIPVEEFVVYSSKLTPEGSVHAVEETFRFDLRESG